MARTTVPRRLRWVLADVVEIIVETHQVKSLVLSIPEWKGHLAGQHVDIRLTAPDGYQVQRSYSIASAPHEDRIDLTIERVADGEVSPYLTGCIRVGDQIEIRGPVGGYFTWDIVDGGPVLLVAGGTGVSPLMSMIRHHAAARSDIPMRLLYSSRSFEEIIYEKELAHLVASHQAQTLQVIHTLTRAQPPQWDGYRRRIDETMLAEIAWSPTARPLIYVCGPTRLVESVASTLITLGYEPSRVKTERFGPTGG
jgi:ferredoxin-NADP reductase